MVQIRCDGAKRMEELSHRSQHIPAGGIRLVLPEIPAAKNNKRHALLPESPATVAWMVCVAQMFYNENGYVRQNSAVSNLLYIYILYARERWQSM
jgi:hypothetical protein